MLTDVFSCVFLIGCLFIIFSSRSVPASGVGLFCAVGFQVCLFSCFDLLTLVDD